MVMLSRKAMMAQFSRVYVAGYLLRANFEGSDLSAPIGASLDKPHISVGGPLLITDAAGTKVAVRAGELEVTGNVASGAEGLVSDTPITRAPGVVYTCKYHHSWGDASASFGLKSSKALPYGGEAFCRFVGSTSMQFGAGQIVYETDSGGRYHNLFIILRATGAFFVLTDEDGKWYMPWVAATGNSASLYPGYEVYRAQLTRIDDLAVFEDSAWDADDKVYTTRVATPSDGEVIATEANCLVELIWTPAPSEVLDILIRRTDDDNCWGIRCDQANSRLYIYQREGGVETERGTAGGAAQTFTSGNSYRVVASALDGTIRAFVNEIAKNAHSDATFNQDTAGAKVSGFTSATNLIAWPADLTNTSLADALKQHAGDRWTHTRLADCPVKADQAGFEELGGKLYFVGGRAETEHSNKAYAYDPALDTWEQKADLPIQTQSPVLRAVNGKLYCIGGWNSQTSTTYPDVYEYDPTLDTWTKMADMPSPREDMGSAVIDGKIYVFGGLVNQAMSSAMEVYDPATNTWDETKADLPEGKWSGDFGCAYNGKIYAVGASDSFAGYPTVYHPTGSTFEYDPVADTWTQKASQPYATMYREVVELDGKLYVVSGVQNGNADKTDKIYAYGPATDTWALVSSSPYAAQGPGLAVYNGAIYMCGGNIDNNTKVGYLYRLNLP